MNILLKALQAGLAAPFALRAKHSTPPPLAPPVWDPVPLAKSACFTVGAAKEDLTPPGGFRGRNDYYMAGYGMWKRVRGFHSSIYATALWIDDNAGHGGVLLLSVDCVGIMNNDVERIRARLAPFCKKTGCRAIHVMATHCHASIDTMGFWGPLPRTGRDKRFFAILFDKIVKAAYAAYKTRKDGDLFAGSVETEGIQQDKRLPEVFSKTLTRLRFVPKDGSREIYVINYAIHPEILGSRNVMLSADFVHSMRKKIAGASGAETVYFNGAIGGMITPVVADDSDLFESTKICGEKVADAALSIREEKKLSPRISLARKEFYVDVSNLVFALCGVMGVLPRERIPMEGGGPLHVAMKTEVNYMEIDTVHILMVPGELFPELAYGGYLEADVAAVGGPELNPIPLCAMADDPELLIFGLANDELGYFIPPNDYLLDEKLPFLDKTYDHGGRRHYEETNATGPYAAHALAESFAEILRLVKG